MTAQQTPVAVPALSHVPHLADDPFDVDVLAEPGDFHRRLRDAGPVVHLDAHGVLGLGRHDEVRAALVNWQAFVSANGVGLTDPAEEPPYRPPGVLLEMDPPDHDAPRHVVEPLLTPRVLHRLREHWTERAEHLVDELLQRGEVDAVTDLAEAFPLSVFPDAVGIPVEGREHLLPYADHLFNTFGPDNELVRAGAGRFPDHMAWMRQQGSREQLTPDGFGAGVWAAVDRGDVTAEQAPAIVRALLAAGIDTTVHALAAIVDGFLRFPDQWDLLRSEPRRARIAFDEAIRWASPVQTFFRVAAHDVQIGDHVVASGGRVLMFLGSANRDPRRWADADTFDLRRDPAGHVGFGWGIHRCVGQHVARLEAECLLTALVARVVRWERTGPPRRHVNNTLRAWASTPVRLHPA